MIQDKTTTTPCLDVLIIGSGASGLSLALHLPEHLNIAVLSKGSITTGSTYYAQGGISAVLNDEDSVDSHVADTLEAGAGLCNEEVVRYTVENGPEAIRWLAELGVDFTREPDEPDTLHLTREGGHSHRRVVHADDATGRAVETSLEECAIKAENIQLLEHRFAIDLITEQKFDLADDSKNDRCLGAYVWDKQAEQVETLRARCTVLACGGANWVYLYSSNPHAATGDGIAMAWRAGCPVRDMEFMQFHPTCLFHPDDRSFLISEAVRGEGGHLKLPNGERFMQRFHEDGELAPRDVVARAIDHEIKRLGIDHVYLDISHREPEFIKQHFPSIYARCLSLGLDMTKEALPVVPAAHYTCGGIETDKRGRTALNNLYAVGETAFTGLHGANRLASNSLLECVVFATAAAKDIATEIEKWPTPPEVPEWDESRVTNSDEEVIVAHNWQELRRAMWNYVGIVRTDKRLERALRRIRMLSTEIDEYYGNFRVSADLIELRNLAEVAELIIRCAQSRKESRGLHYTLDYPELLDEATDSILWPS